MLQEADIGVGISGAEGMQVLKIADYLYFDNSRGILFFQHLTEFLFYFNPGRYVK